MKKTYFIIEKLTTFKLSLLFVLFSFFISSAQVTTNSGSGLAPTYPDLATAITALNGATITSPVVITLTGNETAPVGGYSIIAQGDATNTIIIEGVTSTITANATLTAGTLNDAIFKLVGADYVTIQGFTMLENPANTITAGVTNNMTEWGVALLYATTSNGSQNNTIQNNTIDLNRTYQNTFGIYCNATHAATTPTTSITAIAGGGNSGLKVYTNSITDVNIGILVVGPTAAADQNDGIDIGGSSLSTGNTITNYGTTGTFSGYANVSGTVNGILVRNSKNFNISFNSVTSSNGGTTVGTLRGIFVPAFSNAPAGTIVNNINNNSISVRSAVATGVLQGIIIEGTSGNTTTTLNVNSNNFNNSTHTVVASGAITFINTVSPVLTLNIANNTFTNLNVNTTGSVTFIGHSYTMPAGGSQTISGNQIVTAFTKTGAGGTVTFSSTGASSPNGTTFNHINNVFSNITLSGATILVFINSTDGTGGTSTKTVTGNTFSNVTGGTGAITGAVIAYWSGTNLLSNNTFSNITGQGNITGLNIGNTLATATAINVNNNTFNGLSSTGAGGAVTGIVCSNTSAGISIFDNVINTFSTTGASAVNGITISGANAAGTNVYKHKIYSLSGSNAGSTVNGINITGGALVNMYNNIIGDLTAPIANAANPINGINITGGTTVNAYYNTVMLNATSSGALFGSSAINVSSTPTVTLINNIFVNNSTVTGAGLATAYRRSSTTLTTYGSTSNNNLFFGSTIFTDGTNTDATLAAYKARVSTRDAASVTENPTFVSTTGSDATFLHIDTVAPTFAESGGTNIASVVTDFDGDIRQGQPGYTGTGSSSDIGADEFNGVSSTPSCTGTPTVANALSSNNNFCAGTSTSLSLDVAYTTLNNAYQWESSLDNITFTPISGAISATYSASPVVSTWYRCVVTCTTSTLSASSNSVQVIIIVPTYATIPLTESFETTWATTCVVAPLGQDTPNNSWRMIRGADADASWRADNTTTTLSGWASTLGAYTPVAQDGLRSARFHSYNVSPAGTQGMLDLYVDLSTPGAKQLSYWYIAPSTGIDQLDVLLSEDGGATFNPIATTPALPAATTAVTTWTNITAIINSVSATSIIRFSGTGDNGSFDIGLDNVTITLPCSGTPTAGTITSPTSVCASTPFNLSLTGNTSGVGITYQWQSSPDGVAPYTDIATATNATYSATQTATTFYQCVVTCTNGGASVTTPAVQITMNAVVNCFCPAAPSNTADTDIGNITFGSLNNGTATPVLSNPTAVNNYTSFTSLPATNIVQGETTSFSLRQITSGATFYAAYANVFIDYNGNGVFDLPAERALSVGSTTGTPLNNLLTGNITIPITSVTGNVLMRVVLLEGGSNVTPACSPLATGTTYGEVEDYVINITPCVAPVITTQPAATVSVCENTAVNLSVVATGTGLTYQWKKDTVDIPSATSATYSIPSALVADSGSYTVLVTGACGTILSNASTVTVTANSTLPTEVVSVCDTYTWAANGTTYTTSGIYTNVVNCVTRTLDLTITPSSSLPTEVVSVCDTYTWAANGTTYTTSGIYTNVVNCVTRTLDLTITTSSSLPTEVVSVCDTYTWAANGTTYTTSGIYTNVVNCVTRTLDLTITPSSSLPTEVVSVCDTYTWAANGTTYTTSGIYTNVVNCVTRTLDLTITPSSSLPNEVVSACDSYTWSANGATYTTSGTYTNVVNCVTRTLNLTINASTTTTTNVTVCDTYTWPENGVTYTVGGTYTNVTTNGAGCPNTATLNLVVTNASIDFANLQFPASATICEGGTMIAYGQVYEAGLTEAAGQAAGIDVEFGYNTSNTNPNTWSTWTPATFNVQVGNNDEYLFTTSNALTGGTYYYTFRYRLSGCSTWQYGGDNNGFWNGTTQNSGVLTINAATISGATTQVVNEGVAADATIEDIVVTSNGTVTWFASASDAASNSNPLPAGTVLVNGNIYYGVTNIGACRSTTLAVTVTVVLGNTSFDLSQLSYYPNPVRDIFNVKYSKEIISVDVFDLTGRNVINIKPNALNVQVNMTNLSSAMYIVRLQSVDGIKELKVYKN